ncbi:MAG: hypothetical protein K2W82_12120 [Candidatus Obscuribacterales bacterium]|nr:hypothetical protein [Candidatus Obscuribacterales bacterium]
MSQDNFDALESALLSLKEIVAKNHSSGDCVAIVLQMENLVTNLKTKSTPNLNVDSSVLVQMPASFSVSG